MFWDCGRNEARVGLETINRKHPLSLLMNHNIICQPKNHKRSLHRDRLISMQKLAEQALCSGQWSRCHLKNCKEPTLLEFPNYIFKKKPVKLKSHPTVAMRAKLLACLQVVEDWQQQAYLFLELLVRLQLVEDWQQEAIFFLARPHQVQGHKVLGALA